MAGRQLKVLFKAFHERNELAFRRAAQEIIEEEQAKHHLALARDLQKLLTVGGPALDVGARSVLPEPPRDREGDWALAEVQSPSRSFDDLVLRRQVESLLWGLVNEVSHWGQLDQHGIPRRQRILFQGPPGCGKTSAAEALAAELSWPFVLVRLDDVVSSYLGETASDLRRVLDYADGRGEKIRIVYPVSRRGRSAGTMAIFLRRCLRMPVQMNVSPIVSRR
ncbi:MAG: AAA family ATPase [Sciscionella sp.]